VLSSRLMVSLRRFATGVILAICIGAPILEMFDQWDRTVEDGNDTEINLVVVALCVGVGFSVAGALAARVRASSNRQGRGVLTFESTLTTLLTLASPVPNSRPPTALRV
jgi:hypothetical protein